MASMVTAMDHVLLHALSVPKKYGGTGPDPPLSLHIIPPPAHRLCCSLRPLLPPHSSALTFAEVAASPPPAASVPKSACLHKACTKQGTKATIALLHPSADGPPSNAAVIHDFVATRPLGNRLPLSQAITLRGDWALTFKEPLTLPELQRLQAAVDKFHHPGSEVVNRPTSASLKFPHIPTVRPDGSPVSEEILLITLHSHPRWQDVSFVSNPHFIWPSGCSGNLSTLVHCK
ncbi:hypothetical protein AX15_006431, partial [Amanita polypyramis BW_CC]